MVERFWSKVDRRGPDDCWLWQACTNASGYGRILVDGKAELAHRVSYKLAKGPIPDGLCLDHLCRTPACVNPAHLEAVTSAENTRRGISAQRRRELAAQITHCPRGHEYTADNMLGGRRQCRKCDGMRKQAIARSRGVRAREKLTPEQVADIKTGSATANDLAARYGVTTGHIYNIRNGNTRPPERQRRLSWTV